ncbi:hypothetical protein C8T65DRAFT_216543 [Cerioporus squamosus]|nr:hypothetical protein C8T65DRAFT_216543 [Cerioporus squamosus]
MHTCAVTVFCKHSCTYVLRHRPPQSSSESLAQMKFCQCLLVFEGIHIAVWPVLTCSLISTSVVRFKRPSSARYGMPALPADDVNVNHQPVHPSYRCPLPSRRPPSRQRGTIPHRARQPRALCACTPGSESRTAHGQKATALTAARPHIHPACTSPPQTGTGWPRQSLVPTSLPYSYCTRRRPLHSRDRSHCALPVHPWS